MSAAHQLRHVDVLFPGEEHLPEHARLVPGPLDCPVGCDGDCASCGAESDISLARNSVHSTTMYSDALISLKPCTTARFP